VVLNTKAYIDIKNLESMSKTETGTFEEISEEWENFENEIINFGPVVNHSFIDQALWNNFHVYSKIVDKIDLKCRLPYQFLKIE